MIILASNLAPGHKVIERLVRVAPRMNNCRSARYSEVEKRTFLVLAVNRTERLQAEGTPPVRVVVRVRRELANGLYGQEHCLLPFEPGEMVEIEPVEDKLKALSLSRTPRP